MLVTSCLLVFPIKNVQAGFGVSPPYFNESHLLPGSHCEKVVYLSQSDPSNLTYCEVTIDASEIEDWITIEPGLYFPFWVIMFPLTIIIDVPENASLGNYYGFVRVRKLVYDQQGGQIIVVIGARIDISLTVIDYNYTSWEIDSVSTDYIHIGDPMIVRLLFDNHGNTYACPPYIIVDTYNCANTQLLETHNLTNWTPVAPFARPWIINQCQSNLPCGEYWNHVYGPNMTTMMVFMLIAPYPVLSNPIPQNGSTLVPPINTVLSWSCEGAFDTDHPLKYDVYFGTVNPPPQIISNQTENSSVPILNYSTTYYWKIIAWDKLGGNGIGPLWSFTTSPPNEPPYPPSNPYPSNNTTDIPLTANLSWNGSDPNEWDTVTYDVYFGTSSSPAKVVNNQSVTIYNPGTMSYSTKYYWKIVSWDNHVASTTGPVWDFTTKSDYPPLFGTPSPANGSTNNPLSFTWQIPITDPEGDSFNWVIQCSNGQSANGNGASNGTKSLSLSGLAYSTTYMIWVNATDPGGSGLYTRTWCTFSTKASQPPVFGSPNPANGSANNPLSLTWSIPINDPEGDAFSWTIQCSNGQVNSGAGASNGTKSLSLSALSYSTMYTVWVNATDPGGSELYTREWFIFTTKENVPPSLGAPSPANNSIHQLLSFTWSIPISDPEGDSFNWVIQCSNGQSANGNGASNGTKSLSLSGLAYSTTYMIWVNATDPGGSCLYTRTWYTFTTQQNTPPNKPDRPSGETNGKINTEYTYTTKAIDIDGDQVYYNWSWGDDSYSGWIGPFTSNTTASGSHTWVTKGSYSIKVKAKDTSDAESDWSDPLPITMPLDVVSGNTLLLKQVHQSPNAYPLLRQLLAQ